MSSRPPTPPLVRLPPTSKSPTLGPLQSRTTPQSYLANDMTAAVASFSYSNAIVPPLNQHQSFFGDRSSVPASAKLPPYAPQPAMHENIAQMSQHQLPAVPQPHRTPQQNWSTSGRRMAAAPLDRLLNAAPMHLPPLQSSSRLDAQTTRTRRSSSFGLEPPPVGLLCEPSRYPTLPFESPHQPSHTEDRVFGMPVLPSPSYTADRRSIGSRQSSTVDSGELTPSMRPLSQVDIGGEPFEAIPKRSVKFATSLVKFWSCALTVSIVATDLSYFNNL